MADKKLPSGRTALKWALSGTRVAEFLSLILPYLQLKRPQAELAIAYIKRRKRGTKISPQEHILMEADRILLSSYNKGKPIEGRE